MRFNGLSLNALKYCNIKILETILIFSLTIFKLYQGEEKSHLENKKIILVCMFLNIKNDIEDTHSQYLCVKCYSSIKTLKKRYSDISIQNARAVYSLNKDKWCPFVDGHKTNTCKICTHRMGLTVGCIKRRESGCSSSMIRSATCPETHTTSHQNTSSCKY